MNNIKESRWVIIIGLILPLLIAALAWLLPFEPIGKSPLTRGTDESVSTPSSYAEKQTGPVNILGGGSFTPTDSERFWVCGGDFTLTKPDGSVETLHDFDEPGLIVVLSPENQVTLNAPFASGGYCVPFLLNEVDKGIEEFLNDGFNKGCDGIEVGGCSSINVKELDEWGNITQDYWRPNPNRSSSQNTQTTYPMEFTGGPYLEHRTAYVGTGVFEEVTFSDGTVPYNWGTDDIYQFWRDYPDLIKIIAGFVNEQSRCGVAPFDASKVWVGAPNGAIFSVNGLEVGRVTSSIKSNHGFIVPSWSVQSGDEICIEGLPESETFHIIFGPAIYYLYDSYCTNRVCY